MAVYNDIVFPTDISFHSPGGPRFLTQIVQLPSGHHIADIKRDTPLYGWDVGYGARVAAKIYDLYQLFLTVRGQGHIFLFKFWGDFKSSHGDQFTAAVTPTDQVIATATAGQSAFQLIKNYAAGSAAMIKTIVKPKSGTLRVSVNGAEETSGWVMDANTGIITRSSGLGAGDIVRAGFEYYHPARFSSDDLDISFEAWKVADVKIELMEVRLS